VRRISTLTTALLAAAVLGWCGHAAAGETLTYADLVKRMIDLEHLAVLPAAGETCAQWSSYDRASRYDVQSGKYVDWGANGDGHHFIRQEGDRIVMAEMEGPGCIWRIWSARTGKGHVKIYLDGSEKPAVDLPFDDYFTGKRPPFDYPMLSYQLEDQGSRGKNLYFPIPYQKSCKIVAEKGWGRYYHFTYGRLPKGTKLPTFSEELVAENAPLIREVDTFLRDRLGTDPAGPRAGQQTVRDLVRIAPKASMTLELTGPRAITAIRGTVECADREDEMAALRKLVLRINWDGQKEPAVWCPLGDFFGTAPGANLYRSLLTGISEEG